MATKSLSALARAITNADLWDSLRGIYPNFSSHTSKATAELFTARGYENIAKYDASVLNDFFNLSIRVWLNIINISHAEDKLASADFGEYYDQPWGGYIQRMAIESVRPISPSYNGLQNGDSPDPFVVRKPVTKERFWLQNFDYQSMITAPDEFRRKQIFVSEYGMSEFMAGIMEGLQNGYTLQVYTNKLEAINSALNSTTNPLQDSQKWEVSFANANAPTSGELQAFTISVKNAIEALTIAPQTSAFNAYKFGSTQDKSRLRLLVRQGYKAPLSVEVLANAFNKGELDLDVPIIVVPDFGGMQPYLEEGLTTPLYPVYDDLGTTIGYNTTANQSSVTVETDNVFWKDPNKNTYAILADKGVIFECSQNPYTVEPIRNPRGLYTNFWASSPNNTIAYDPAYNMIVFQNSNAEA